MVNANHIYLGVLLIWASLKCADADKCLKSRIPNNDLAKALYRADPNPKTGYLELTDQRNFIRAILKRNTLHYNTWLSHEHDARKEMVNLWSYLTNLIVSNIPELYAHYGHSSVGGRFMGIVNFDNVKALFDTACSNWNSVKNTWPYTCLDSAFFCRMSSAIDKQKDIVSSSYYDMRRHPPRKVEEMRPASGAMHASIIATDDSSRTRTLEAYFRSDILEFIPEKAQDDVFHHSNINWKFIERLLVSKSSFHSWSYKISQIVRVNQRCNSLRNQPVGAKYYCKVQEVREKFNVCDRLSDVTPCIFDSDLQTYFSRGRFGQDDELDFLNDMIAKTGTLLTEFKDKVVAHDRRGLDTLYNKYNSHITVDDSMCRADWPNAFNCTNNIGCGSNLDSHKFDCNGGHTCRINMMYRFDCMLKFVLKQTKQLVDVSYRGDWDLPSVTKAKYDLMIWLSYLPMARYTSLGTSDINNVIITTQDTINDFVTNFDTDGLETFSTNLPPMNSVPFWAKNAVCHRTSVATEYKIFCHLEPLLNSVFLFIDAFKNSKNSTIKVLNPTVDYPYRLSQLQLVRIGHYIHLQTQALVNGITNGLKENFGQLSEYFSELAKYDKTKSDADIAYIEDRLKTFKKSISTVSDEVAHMYQIIFGFAVGANVLDLIGRATNVGLAVAQAAHPGNHILGGSSLLDLSDSLNELAQAGVTTAIISELDNKEYPALISKAKDLGNKFRDNAQQMEEAKRLIGALKNGIADAVDTASNFLVEYNGYTPKVLRSDISSFGTLWENVAEQMCEAGYASGSANSAMVEIGLASTGDCVKIGPKIAELVTLYEELYDYQFDLMDSLADASRAYLAYQKATEMKHLYTTGAYVDKAFLRKSAVNTFMVSTLNIWEVVTEYCDMLTYTRGGHVPDVCGHALQSPTVSRIAAVISYRPKPLCHINNEITHYRSIPTSPSSSGDQAYVDLKALYAREMVTFKIPNFQWLKDNRWVGPQDSQKAMYIKRFELFLTPMSGTQEHIVELQVEPSMANYLEYGKDKTKYLLPVTGYTARYTENSINCYNEEIRNPYALCRATDLVKLCITSNGYINRTVQPSLFTEWKIKATSLPTNQSPPNSKTDFNLQAAITMCVIDLHQSGKKRDITPYSSILRKRDVEVKTHCCASNKYWTGAKCSVCPSGSHQKLHGFFCG